MHSPTLLMAVALAVAAAAQRPHQNPPPLGTSGVVETYRIQRTHRKPRPAHTPSTTDSAPRLQFTHRRPHYIQTVHVHTVVSKPHPPSIGRAFPTKSATDDKTTDKSTAEAVDNNYTAGSVANAEIQQRGAPLAILLGSEGSQTMDDDDDSTYPKSTSMEAINVIVDDSAHPAIHRSLADINATDFVIDVNITAVNLTLPEACTHYNSRVVCKDPAGETSMEENSTNLHPHTDLDYLSANTFALSTTHGQAVGSSAFPDADSNMTFVSNGTLTIPLVSKSDVREYQCHDRVCDNWDITPKQCDDAVNFGLLRDNVPRYAPREVGGDEHHKAPTGIARGGCSRSPDYSGCCIHVSGDPSCRRSGNDMWNDYQMIRDVAEGGCARCGKRVWSSGEGGKPYCETKVEEITAQW